MGQLRNIIIFLAGLALASPAMALPDLKTLSNDALIELYDSVRSVEKPKTCEEMVPVLAELLRRPSIKGNVQGQKTLADFNCAIDERQWVTAYRLMPDTEAHLKRDLGSLGFLIALFSDHHANAAQRLIALARSKDGEELLSIDDRQIFGVMRELWIGKQFETRNKFVIALLDSPHFAKLSGNMQSGLASAVIDEEGRTGNFRRSVTLLDKVDSPDSFTGLLSMKNFSPIWPQVEKAAGPNLANVTERQLKADRARYKKNPEDREAFQQVAHALHFAGKFEEVVKFAAALDHSAAAIAKIGEDEAWTLNVEAYALDALGRRAEAETIFDRIAAIPYDPEENGWLVSFTINRGSRLVELGQWEKGLEAAMLAGKVTEESGSPYAKMLVRRDKICALANIGRRDDAQPLIEEIFAQRKESYPSATTALLCTGDNDRAAAVVIEALSDPVYAEGMVDEMQKPGFQSFYTQSKLPTIREVLLPRPDVRAAYDKVGRDIPDAFMPLAGKRKAELAAARP